jgi:hypothetical protein
MESVEISSTEARVNTGLVTAGLLEWRGSSGLPGVKMAQGLTGDQPTDPRLTARRG